MRLCGRTEHRMCQSVLRSDEAHAVAPSQAVSMFVAGTTGAFRRQVLIPTARSTPPAAARPAPPSSAPLATDPSRCPAARSANECPTPRCFQPHSPQSLPPHPAPSAPAEAPPKSSASAAARFRIRLKRRASAISVNRSATALVKFPILLPITPAAIGDTPLILSSACRTSLMCDSSLGVVASPPNASIDACTLSVAHICPGPTGRFVKSSIPRPSYIRILVIVTRYARLAQPRIQFIPCMPRSTAPHR